jgi:hypothetical protein
MGGGGGKTWRQAPSKQPVFGVVYAGFDTYGGLATGTVVTGILLAVKGLFNGPIIGVLYIVGTAAAWTLGAGAVAYTQ